jgi:hypothetical protein
MTLQPRQNPTKSGSIDETVNPIQTADDTKIENRERKNLLSAKRFKSRDS